jgi:tetratricopeptide (TPR) repeat protein
MLAAEVAIRALYNDPSPAPGDMTKVSQWLEEGAAKPDPEARALALQLQASLRNLQNNGDYEGAEALYKQAIASNNRDVLAMNNLAFLLSAHKNQYAEALAWIEKAKAIIGPTNPTLLDTEALIRMKNGEFDKAYELMEIVIAEAPSKAAYFHLAQIQRERKKMTEARLAWQEALRRGLTRGDLHTLEHKAFDNFPNTLK